MDDNLRIWRSFSMGKLLDLIMIDTRNYDRSITDLTWNSNYIDLIRDSTARTLMGSHQENWFYNQLSKSHSRGATWRIVGNQLIFSRLDRKGELSGDTWDVSDATSSIVNSSGLSFADTLHQGYTANRNRTLSHLYGNNIGNNVFLAGDSHANWVADLAWLGEKPYDQVTGQGAIGVELGGTAVSSTGYGGEDISKGNRDSAIYVKDNAELQWSEGYYRGYYEINVTPQSVDAQFFGKWPFARRMDLLILIYT